jgi:hypothetical protein
MILTVRKKPVVVEAVVCGTKVKVVGHTTKHYEPVVDRDYIVCELHNIDFVTYQEGRKSLALLKHQIADAIISAMYGTVDNVATVESGEK